MSIRLRLTLLYTAILVLTLTAFSAILYGTQLQSILAGERRMLAGIAQRFAERRPDDHTFEERPFFPLPPREEGDQDRRFGVSIYVQLISPEGQVVHRSENLEEVNLPLSDAGWRAVRTGEEWAEAASVEGERMLIYSAPVVVEGQVAQVVQVARSLADQYQYLSTMGRNLLVGSGLATIIAFGAGWVLSGVVLRPVNRITQTAQAIGIERDFGRRVDYTGPNDEIGQLATTFNRMLTQLQAAYQQVERSLQQQRQFVADVSHELRTPLTTIRGNLALLRRESAVGAEEETDILEDMVGESDRLIRLVNDLLALAHAESGRQLQSETVWVKPLVEDVCRQARLLDSERTITCTDLVDVAVVGDRDAFKQVLLILLDNALKHTNGAIAVSTAIIDERAAVRMRDSGPGIDPEVLPHVFERFYRGDEARSRPGIGLGLPIARALVEAQNGTISIESQVAHGSIITVTLPRTPVQREDPEAARR